jgi:hypothetical protein
MAKPKKSKKSSGVRRQERRFVSRAASNPLLVRLLACASGLVLGAGAYAYFWGKSFVPATPDVPDNISQLPMYLIAGGAVVLGIAIWFGTSADPPIRVGAPGLALEKGELRRMPWWGVEKISFENGSLALIITGKDDAGVDWTFKVSSRSNSEAVGWIIKEALDRIPRKVDIAEETLANLPQAHEHAGTKVDLDPLQVVGRRCAVSGKTISYEPDARVCPQCERVYFKQSVPKKCKCGASLLHLRPKDAEETEDSDTETEEEAAEQ